MSDEHPQQLKHVSVNNCNYTENIPIAHHYLIK